MEITIILSCYNKEKYIAEALQSVLSQSVKTWRLIVIDDCSTDNSVNILKSYETTTNVQIVYSKVNKGANYCRNLGLGLTTTEFVMFLDGDDLLANSCIENRLATAKSFGTANMLVFTMGVFKEKVGDTNYLWRPLVNDPLKNLLSHNLSWSIVQPLWKTDFLKSLNGFDLTFKRLQDVELNTRALLQATLKLKMFNSAPDCFYRTDPNRINYDLAEFLERWVDGCLQYVAKFDALAPLDYRKYLRLTLFQTYLQILYYKRVKGLSPQVFSALELKLTKSEVALRSIGKRAWLFSMAAFFDGKIKVPGVNYIIRQFLLVA